MSVSNTVVAAIIQTRVNQLSQFARPQQGTYDRGYRIMLRDRRDQKRQMTKGEIGKARELESMLETTGLLLDGEKPSDRDSFRTFMRKGIRDTLIYDQLCFEKIRDRKGRISRFVCLPGETIRPAVVDSEHLDPQQMRDRVAYVQVYESTVIAEFGKDDLAWCIMNPRSDLRANGFGFAPMEQTVRLITAWLYGFQYNQNFFTQGSAIKGVLNIKGTIPDRQLRAFRRMWYSMISGVQNAWKTPILNSEDIQWISMHANNREMEYGAWMDWITKIICSVFGIDPLEINFDFKTGGGSGGKGSALSASRPNADEITESKDKGLVPLADHLVDHINQHIIWELAPELEFCFTGLDAKSEEKERTRRKDEVEKWKTVNEIRAEQDEPPLPDKQGEIILNPVYLQWVQGQQQAAAGADPNAALGPGEDAMDEGGDEMSGDAGLDAETDDEAGPPQKQAQDAADNLQRSQRDTIQAAAHFAETATRLRKSYQEIGGERVLTLEWEQKP
jgi:hypothetical protein